MGKRSQRRPLRYEKDRSGCMWGLISIFDFRQGRSTQRLISDRKREGRPVSGAGYSRNKFEVLTNLGEDNKGTVGGKERTTAVVKADADKRSVKKLIEEEMFSEQDMKKENCNAEAESKPSKPGHESNIKTGHKRTKKTRLKSCDMDNHDLDSAKNVEPECSCKQNAEKRSIESIHIDEIMEDFCRWIYQKSSSSTNHDQDDEVQMQSKQNQRDFDRLRGAIKELINQKSINVKHLKEDGKLHHSKEVSALEILSSDEEFLQKLMQDPNSLLVKYILNLQDGQIGKGKELESLVEPNLSELEFGHRRQSEEHVNHKQQRNFFRRKVKSHERVSSKQIGNENSEVSKRIVILKPGPADLQNSKTECSVFSSPKPHYIVGDKGSTERVGGQFSLGEIKRKLKSAIRKESSGISTMAVSTNFPHCRQSLGGSETGIDKENAGKTSPSKDHFYMERIVRPAVSARKGDMARKLKDSEGNMKTKTIGHPNQMVSSIYVEAKKHLSQMLSNGDESGDFSSKQVPKSLGRILSLPEYKLSPVGSPGTDWEDEFVTAQMRFSACAKIQKGNSNTWSPKRENNVSHLGPATQNLESRSSISDCPDNKVQAHDSKKNISDDFFPVIGDEGTFVSATDKMSPEGASENGKSTEFVAQEETSVLCAPPDPSCSSSTRDDQNTKTFEICDDKGYCESLKQESYEEKQVPSSPLVSSPISLINKKVENLESATDIPERPSPVSVLEPLFPEDDISPTKSIFRSVEMPLQPLQIQFDEHESSVASQVNCTKTCMEDKEFIFEYIKAVLQASGLNWNKICAKCLTSYQLLEPSLFDEVECFPNQLGYDQKLLFDCTDEVLHEVCQYYFGCCPWVSFMKPSIRPVPNMKKVIHEVWEGVYWHFLPMPLPHTLDQIVKKDMARMGTWMDLHFDVDTIGIEMGEAILEDLIKDIMVGFVDDNPESGYTAVLTDSENRSSSNL
ncbi:uncharacterized protein LOC122309985 isoform X1 [Carya illinoinensis]|nr:uncharacterized protein LOC122309985 isoform X1 [Carya illinoinensis]XP_042979782.1 uncharacterized protein LOC122309985 isoform X1 [Carya illinoinensis]KAG6666860.1 hypothetical protein CIPAW_01G061400 [Carya illinoinensis]